MNEAASSWLAELATWQVGNLRQADCLANKKQTETKQVQARKREKRRGRRREREKEGGSCLPFCDENNSMT